MPRVPRLNKVIELLERKQPVFCAAVARNGDFEQLAGLSEADFDMVIVEMEHQGFDMPTLRHSLQHLLSRARMASKASLQPDVVPFVRVAPNAREQNEWVIKQTLDLCCKPITPAPPPSTRRSSGVRGGSTSRLPRIVAIPTTTFSTRTKHTLIRSDLACER